MKPAFSPDAAKSPCQGTDNRFHSYERIGIILLASIYLIQFKAVVAIGDGPVYAQNVESGQLVLNPNHLLVDPVALVWCRLLWLIDANIGALDAFRIASGVSTVISLLLFHAVLVSAGVRQRLPRVLAVLGLFASRNFLTMAISDEIFMLQMPFLMMALLILVKIMRGTGNPPGRSCWSLGAYLGLASAISINNVLLGVAVVLHLLFVVKPARYKIQVATTTASAAILTTVPLFLVAYLWTDTDSGFLSWMISYQGHAQAAQHSLYGLVPTVEGAAQSVSRLILNSLTNFVSVGALGTVAKSVVFDVPLEMRLEPAMVLFGALLLVATIAALSVVAIWVVRNVGRCKLLLICVAWISPFYIFNFLWNDSSDQFWFQILPAMWLILAIYAHDGHDALHGTRRESWKHRHSLIAFLPPLFLALNTTLEVAPNHFIDIAALAKEHRKLLRSGDIEVLPGWDGLRWTALEGDFPEVRQINLMTAAMRPVGDPNHISNLARVVAAHLRSGRRVVVVRLFDFDSDPRPWDQLRKLGWPRERIQKSLSEFDARKLQVIDEAVFRELVLQPASASPPSATNDANGQAGPISE